MRNIMKIYGLKKIVDTCRKALKALVHAEIG